MLKLTLDQVDAGMETGMPVYHPHHEGVVLLRSGAVLSSATIDRLRTMGLPEVWVRVPGMEHVGEYYSTSLVAARAEVSASFADLVARLRGQVAGGVSFDRARAAVAALVEQVEAQPTAAIFAYDMDRFAEPLVRHASAMCYLSVLIGQRLGFYLAQERPRVNPALARDLVPLGLGALLCDLGAAHLPKRSLDHWARGMEETDLDWPEHTRLGYDLVKRRIEPAAASMVLHHHQRWNGTGFPQEIRAEGVERGAFGREIHIYARIASAADLFLRLQSVGDRRRGERERTRGAGDHGGGPLGWLSAGRASTSAMPSVRALRLMQLPGYSSWVDTVVMRGLVNAVPAFAPGAAVTLNDGREGVVSSWSALEPCQPRVSILIGPARVEPTAAVEGEGCIDLRTTPGLEIASVDGIPVSDDLFKAKHPFAYDLGAIERVLHAPSEQNSGRIHREVVTAGG